MPSGRVARPRTTAELRSPRQRREDEPLGLDRGRPRRPPRPPGPGRSPSSRQKAEASGSPTRSRPSSPRPGATRDPRSGTSRRSISLGDAGSDRSTQATWFEPRSETAARPSGRGRAARGRPGPSNATRPIGFGVPSAEVEDGQGRHGPVGLPLGAARGQDRACRPSGEMARSSG